MFKKILLFFVCAAITSGVVITTGCTNTGNAEIKESVGEITDETGKNLNDGVIHDLPIQLLFNPRALSNEAEADTAMKVTLRATITPENATNKAVDWSVSFVNASSSWASGKTVTDYVTITPTEDGSLIAEVECKEAFGEQIKITVVSRDNPEAVAECTVDYKQKFLGYKVSYFGQFDSPIGNSLLKYGVNFNSTDNVENPVIFSVLRSKVFTVPLLKSEVVLPVKAVCEFDVNIRKLLGSINQSWQTGIDFSLKTVETAETSLSVRFFHSKYLFSKLLVQEKFNTNDMLTDFVNILKDYPSDSPAFFLLFYDKDENLLGSTAFSLYTDDLTANISVESVSIDNDNITM